MLAPADRMKDIFDERLNKHLAELQYPHFNLDSVRKAYQINSSLPPAKEIEATYRRRKAEFAKIEAVKDDDQKWFKALKEVKIEGFVEDNVAYRLGTDLTNKTLWKLYFGFLKDVNQKACFANDFT
uniref:Uncharacterized protein n=1 Tax=Panagrolaimus davidi TaxID=227884 RepID=A0A914QKK5_9BILA